VIATGGGVDDELSGFCGLLRGQGIVAAMGCFADAAGMGRGGCRQGQRGEVSHERREQEESGNKSMYALIRDARSLPSCG
jgi:hypothetical protein